MLENASASYRRALWQDQPTDVQIYTEKDAISGVLLPVTLQWDVPLGVCRGYVSESFAWQVAQSVSRAEGDVYLYQFGDHDPSGVDAWRDLTTKVRQFIADETASDFIGCEPDDVPWLHCERLAVTPEQIASMSLPTRPTKQQDTRAGKFRGESVEVDAIPAPVLRQLAEDAITQHIDPIALSLTRVAEQSEREVLTNIMRRP